MDPLPPPAVKLITPAGQMLVLSEVSVGTGNGFTVIEGAVTVIPQLFELAIPTVTTSPAFNEEVLKIFLLLAL